MAKTLDSNELQRFWLQQLERAEDRKKQWREKFKVEECYKFFIGDQKPENYAEEDWFTLNLIYSNIHAQIPSLYFKDPYAFVRLKRSFKPDPAVIQFLEDNMRVREGVMNYLVGENDFTYKGQLCILDAYFQFGMLKTRYVSKFERNPNAGKIRRGKDGASLKDMDGKPLMEPDDILVAEKFKWERVNPNMILVSADAGCEHFGFIAQKCVDYYDNIKNNPLYDGNTAKLKSDTSLKDYDVNSDNADQSEGFLAKLGGRARKKGIKGEGVSDKLVTFWEIYDITRQEMWHIAKQNDRPLLRKPIPKGIEDHPYSDLRFNDNPDLDGEECWYPIPEIFNQLGPQQEYNLARNDVAIHRKRFKRKYGYYEGVLDDNELDKLEDPTDGGGIRFNHPDWQAKFAAIEDPSLNSAVYFDSQQLRVDFYDMSGTGPDTAIGGGSDTATEAEILNTRLQIRESDKQFRIRKFLIVSFRKMHQLLQAQLTQEGAVRVVGPRGKTWIPYNRDTFKQIPGEIEFDIDVASMAPRNIAVERAQWIQFIQTVMQAPMLFQEPRVLELAADKFDIHDESLIQALAKQLQQMTQMAIQQEGLLANMPGGSVPVTNIEKTLKQFQGG